jgi:hypothetical protein
VNNLCKFQKEDPYLTGEKWRETSVLTTRTTLESINWIECGLSSQERVHNLVILVGTLLLGDLVKNQSVLS